MQTDRLQTEMILQFTEGMNDISPVAGFSEKAAVDGIGIRFGNHKADPEGDIFVFQFRNGKRVFFSSQNMNSSLFKRGIHSFKTGSV